MAATDPQTAADEIRGWLDAHPDAELFEFPRAWLAELLADRARIAAELEQVRGELNEEYALYRPGRVSNNPAEHWTGPGANGAAEAAAWGLRAAHNVDVSVVRRYVTPWRPAATDAETTATRPADGLDGAVWSAGLGNALPGAQRGAEGDGEAEG